MTWVPNYDSGTKLWLGYQIIAWVPNYVVSIIKHREMPNENNDIQSRLEYLNKVQSPVQKEEWRSLSAVHLFKFTIYIIFVVKTVIRWQFFEENSRYLYPMAEQPGD